MNRAVNLRYGKDYITANIDRGKVLGEIRPNYLPVVADLEQELTNVMRHPVGSEPLAELAKRAGNAVIVISDHTRPVPSARILPILVRELESAGLSREQMQVLIGLGNHRPVTEEEKRFLTGKEYGRITCLHSKETGYSLVGITTRGTPVEVAKPVAEADLIIALGGIEFHQLAGYTGGVKAVAAGTASPRSLEHNHRLSTLQENGLGKLDGNVVRDDMLELAGNLNLRFIVNVVLNELHEIVYVVGGDPVAAHKTGCSAAARSFLVKVEQKADIVIISPGGEPKDSTVYQAQKSLRNALKAVENDGIIIVAAQCREGLGDPEFQRWINESSQPEQILNRADRKFVLGGHKAAFVASAVKKARVFWVSDMMADEVRNMFFEPFESLQQAIDAALDEKGGDSTILLMPWAGLTVPHTGQLIGG